MPRFILEEKRILTERFLIEADSEVDARYFRGTIIDHDDGQGSSYPESAEIYQVDEDQEELG